jgi:hypothetical protein
LPTKIRRLAEGAIGQRLGLQVDESRRLDGPGPATFVFPSSEGYLCVATTAVASVSCGDRLSRTEPVTELMSTSGPAYWGAPNDGPTVLAGVALDGVASISFRDGTRRVTVPVRHNVYVWHGRYPRYAGPPKLAVTFRDGSTVRYPP